MRLTYNRTFHIQIDGGGTYFLKHWYAPHGPLFATIGFPFAKARQINLQLEAEHEYGMLNLLANIAICCRRLDKEPNLRSLEIELSDIKPLTWKNGQRGPVHWQKPNGRADVQVVLRHLALLRNVEKASITFPERMRDDRELQALAEECQQAMMTTRAPEEHERHEQLFTGNPEPKPQEENLLEQAGFGVNFGQRQRFEGQWEKLWLDILPIYARLLGKPRPRNNVFLTESQLLDTHS